MDRTTKFFDLNLVTLIAANGIVIWQYSVNGGEILNVLWIYWLQSIVIGAINIWRILSIPIKLDINKELLKIPGLVGADKTASLLTRIGACLFFMFHYGIFHIVYASFLISFSISGAVMEFGGESTTLEKIFTGTVDVRLVIISGLFFAVHHICTFLVERNKLKLHPEEAPGVHEVVRRPYSRIIPMHLTIILGPLIAFQAGIDSIFVVFVIIKMIVDISLYRKGSSHPGTIKAF